MKNLLALSLIISFTVLLSACSVSQENSPWLLIDNFEQQTLSGWQNADTQNNTKPYVAKPQITEIRLDNDTVKNNHYLIKKPAKDGVIGNRKALSIKTLPEPVPVGDTYTFYTRIQLESFPNNHAFGISNLTPAQVKDAGYNAFEPTLRVTDKFESNGFKNDGTLMVKIDSDNKYRQYSKVQNFREGRSANPMQTNTWYQIWYVVNNSRTEQGGQSYDVYLQGGEFTKQTLVYKDAAFRMKRELALISFVANTNTGSHKKPYGNGGLAYDDLYMSKGINLTNPTKR
ncbi:hypothetical protein Q4503_06540 [Colwellia sp. 6_MG-2023]|uniref:hypothetical protein n=1 Tax=Colwellia sp. 6_MG-2023 TaxID=3062676 RepID=UPI0026E25E14|nr:hypothetical protein [Colwellia sp. 6_MG-2023]MDO6487352.1 hypothetical protein [Colwellia sp. 6_MG-2023]